MKFVAISDTHGQHNNLRLPQADVIIHAGDITKRGNKEEVVEFLTWFAELPFTYKIFIAGNHDFFFEESSEAEIENLIPSNVIYLCNNSVLINGIKIWGSPITPYFFNWAFNRHRGDDISKYWDLIPMDTDILITHGPPFQFWIKQREG
ncbi:MAG TPA: metallophosphoesterase [Bacteroidia bacterium]|jgi:predicted phosphohydrolase